MIRVLIKLATVAVIIGGGSIALTNIVKKRTERNELVDEFFSTLKEEDDESEDFWKD